MYMIKQEGESIEDVLSVYSTHYQNILEMRLRFSNRWSHEFQVDFPNKAGSLKINQKTYPNITFAMKCSDLKEVDHVCQLVIDEIYNQVPFDSIVSFRMPVSVERSDCDKSKYTVLARAAFVPKGDLINV